MQLDSRIPSGPIEQVWDKCKFDMKLVNPANKRKYTVIVVGTGLAGGAASATCCWGASRRKWFGMPPYRSFSCGWGEALPHNGGEALGKADAGWRDGAHFQG